MFDRLITAIRVKSREEWIRLFRENWMKLRIWIQEHGELAFLVGAGIGVLIFLATTLFIWLVILAVIAAFVVWSIALPEGQQRSDNSSSESGQSSDQSHTE